MDKQYIASFEFKVSLGQVSYIAQPETLTAIRPYTLKTKDIADVFQVIRISGAPPTSINVAWFRLCTITSNMKLKCVIMALV